MKMLDTGDKIFKYNKSVVIKFIGKRAVLSTGVINGGYSENLTSIFNHDAKTAPGMGCQLKAATYKEHMEIISQEMGLNPKYTTGIATAADMENMCIVVEKFKDLSVTALVTAGIETNGGRVGDKASYTENNGEIEKLNHGTINIIVSVNANLPPRTLTRALVTITEAKTAAIQELLEGSKYSHGIATGSGTDGTIVYANLESENIYSDAGKHSKLGELLGKSVKKAVKEALAKQSGLTPQRQKSVFRRFKRYGLNAEKIWNKYIEINPEMLNKKLEYIEFIEKIEKRAMSRSDSIANKEFIGLMLFVAIPFPGTGAWTGALIAALLQFERKKSFFYIGLGVIIAATLMTLASYGVISIFAPKH